MMGELGIYSGSKYSGSVSEDCWNGDEDGPSVELNVYDLADIGVCLDMSSLLLSINESTMSLWDMGIFHSGIVINGVEYSFGFCEHGTGVYCCEPKSACGASYRCTISMGQAKYPSHLVDMQLTRLATKWQGSSYSLLSKNCNHFCEHVCRILGVPEQFPPWINALAASFANMSPWASQPLVSAAKDHIAFRRPPSKQPRSKSPLPRPPHSYRSAAPRKLQPNLQTDEMTSQEVKTHDSITLPPSLRITESPCRVFATEEMTQSSTEPRREVELLKTPKAWTPGFYHKELELSDNDGCEDNLDDDEDDDDDDDDEVALNNNTFLREKIASSDTPQSPPPLPSPTKTEAFVRPPALDSEGKSEQHNNHRETLPHFLSSAPALRPSKKAEPQQHTQVEHKAVIAFLSQQ